MKVQLRYAQKFVVIVFVLLLPLIFASRAYVTQNPRTQIQFGEQERRGIQYIRPLTALLFRVVDARSSSSDVGSAVAVVDAADQRYGEALKTSRQWGEWKHLLDKVRSGGTPSFDQYKQLTRGLTDLVLRVANTSNLILDPSLDSYYLMDVVVVRQPMLLDQVGQAVRLAASDPLSATDHDALVIARSTIDGTADAIAVDLKTAFDNTNDARVEDAIAQPSAAFAGAVALTSTMLANVVEGRRPTPDVSGLLAATRTLDAATAEHLDGLIAGRNVALQHRVRTITEVLLLLSALLLLLATGLATSAADGRAEDRRAAAPGAARQPHRPAQPGAGPGPRGAGAGSGTSREHAVGCSVPGPRRLQGRERHLRPRRRRPAPAGRQRQAHGRAPRDRHGRAPRWR